MTLSSHLLLAACDEDGPPPDIPDAVYQTESVAHGIGDLILVAVAHTGDPMLWWMRCEDDDCATPKRESGAYRLRQADDTSDIDFFPDGAPAPVRVAYAIAKSRLVIRPPGRSTPTVLDPIDEVLCDETAGFWADDDAPASGLWCDCGQGRAWSKLGCAAP